VIAAHTDLLFDLTGSVAIITGSSRGIGRAIAMRLAQHGACVTISSRNRERCEKVAHQIGASDRHAIVQTCNIGRKDELQALVDATLRKWGRIDTLVCNASINPHFGPALDLPDDTWDRILNYNLRSTFWLCNMALPHMARQGGGSVIIISSIGGFCGSDTLGAYSITKAAEMQLVRNAAVEWGPKQIRANCIAPGLIETDFAREIWSDPVKPARAEQIAPLQRIGQPDDIAGAAVFLASGAGRFVTGQALLIDGGKSIANRVASQ
jgi:NAD(P)-dependent dehydrogenase (short-subunit alcohol dehydrogenase family)